MEELRVAENRLRCADVTTSTETGDDEEWAMTTMVLSGLLALPGGVMGARIRKCEKEKEDNEQVDGIKDEIVTTVVGWGIRGAEMMTEIRDNYSRENRRDGGMLRRCRWTAAGDSSGEDVVVEAGPAVEEVARTRSIYENREFRDRSGEARGKTDEKRHGQRDLLVQGQYMEGEGKGERPWAQLMQISPILIRRREGRRARMMLTRNERERERRR